MGVYVRRCEDALADRFESKHAILCSSGTAALHLACLALGVMRHHCVAMPAMSYVATANAVHYSGARPVFADIDPYTWNLNPDVLRTLVKRYGRSIVGIIPVHLYGMMGPIEEYREIAETHGCWLVEDAAEAINATYKDKYAGTFGDIGIFSFYGNKVITCGEGGLLLTNSDGLAEKIRLYRGQGQDPNRRYYHGVVGYNYRMTDLQAAVLLGQLEGLHIILHKRRLVMEWYTQHLAKYDQFQRQSLLEGVDPSWWMMVVKLPNGSNRDTVAESLRERGVETRPTFFPLHRLPMYQCPKEVLPVTDELGSRGLCLPTHANLTEDDVKYVVEQLVQVTNDQA